MQLFLAHIPDPLQASLQAEEARHCVKVLRHQVGDEIMVMDGCGMAYRAEISAMEKMAVNLRLLEAFPEYGEAPVRMTLVFSPLRLKDRLEWLVEKAVELGVSRLIPVHCHHTDKYKSSIKKERLETLILTATKQCLRSRIPVLEDTMSWGRLMKSGLPEQGLAYLAQAEGEKALSSFAKDIQAATEMCLAIGPEGDFSSIEIEEAMAGGWQRVHLGTQRLRSETAAMFGLSVFKMIKGF